MTDRLLRPLARAGLLGAALLAPLAAHAQGGFTWASGPALAQGRDHHAVWASPAGDRLYVAGGTDYRGVFGDVWSARVRPDGGVDAWTAEPALPAARAGGAAVMVDGTAVFIGGQQQDLTKMPEVWTARARPDGTLEAWQPAPALPAGRFHHAAVVNGRDVYVVGGQGAQHTSEATVFVARLAADGTLGAWREAGRLHRPRSHQGTLVHDGWLYVIGGLDGNPAQGPALHSDVRRAPLQPDGTLGEWQLVSLMPDSYATHSAYVHGGWVYVMGGVENNFRFVDAVMRAPVRADGRLGAWQAVTPGLPAVRAHVHVTPVIAGRVYSVGGSAMRQVRTQVDIGTIPTDAPPAQ